jgi:hypothetical protein
MRVGFSFVALLPLMAAFPLQNIVVPSTNRFQNSRLSSSNIVCNSNVKLGVCQGSSCMAKCKGDFNPLNSFREISTRNSDNGIQIEEVFCLDACKRGPNARIYVDNQIASLEGMNDSEKSRKMFMSVVRESDVNRVWTLAKQLSNGEIQGELFKLTDDGRYVKI